MCVVNVAFVFYGPRANILVSGFIYLDLFLQLFFRFSNLHAQNIKVEIQDTAAILVHKIFVI